MSNKKLSFYQTQMKFSSKPLSVNTTVTKITNAAPAVMTVSEMNLKTGDVVFITSENEMVKGFYQIKSSGSGTYELVGSDFTQVGDIKNPKYAKADTIAFCMATSLDYEPVTVSFSDVTTNCDGYPMEEGELEAGSASGSAYYNPENPVHILLRNHIYSQEPLFFQWKPRDTNILTGVTVAVESFSVSGQTKEKYTADFGLKLQSKDSQITLEA